MQPDTPFRLAVAAYLVLRGLVGLTCWLRWGRGGDQLDRRQEGLALMIAIRFLAAVYLAAVVAWVVEPRWFAWSVLQLPDWLRWLGGVLLALGLLLVTWSLVTLGRNFTDTVVMRPDHTLVTRGPYGWVRHPLYLAYAVVVAGVSLLTANGFPATAGGTVLVLLALRTPREEARLQARFGDAYRRYQEQTGRFLPRNFS